LAFRSLRKVFSSPVLAVDALGVSQQIDRADEVNLVELHRKLDRQYYNFRASDHIGVPLFARWPLGRGRCGLAAGILATAAGIGWTTI
jgi:hypothetical protein